MILCGWVRCSNLCISQLFFSFLRISNLVPHTVATFCPLEQLTRGDIFFAPPGVHMLIKWSKTMQMRDSVKLIKLPSLQGSSFCPVQALKNLFLLSPVNQDTPLFQVKNDKAQRIPLTDTKARCNCHQILSRLGFQNSKMSLHTFRYSGATLVFNSNVSIQNIQSHGTWTSNCVWKYIVQECLPTSSRLDEIYLLFYVAFNSQGHIATGSLQVEETSAYCTVNHQASASNYQLSNMKCPA